MSTNNLLKLVIPTATIESQIIEDLTTRLNLNDNNEAAYWINQVIGKKSVIDFLADQIAAMIDAPINVRIPQNMPQADNAVKFDTNGRMDYRLILRNSKEPFSISASNE